MKAARLREPQDFARNFTKEHYKLASKAIIGIKVSLSASTFGGVSLVYTCMQHQVPHKLQYQCMTFALCSTCQGRLQGLLRRLIVLSSLPPMLQRLMSKPILLHQKRKGVIEELSMMLLSCRCKCIGRA